MFAAQLWLETQFAAAAPLFRLRHARHAHGLGTALARGAGRGTKQGGAANVKKKRYAPQSPQMCSYPLTSADRVFLSYTILYF